MAKLRSSLAWGSDAWIESHVRRTHVEGIDVVKIVKTSLKLAAKHSDRRCTG